MPGISAGNRLATSVVTDGFSSIPSGSCDDLRISDWSSGRRHSFGRRRKHL